MPRHKDLVPLQHMLDHAREAADMIAGRRVQDLADERMFELALVRLIEIIGEAAGRVSSQTRDRYPDIPWREIIGMRNRLIHGYDSVDLSILWDTVEVDLPPLVAQLKNLVKEVR